jgi:RimJ/RimL family protein N-acetyltransferase
MPEEKLSVREIQQEDIELIINYWLYADKTYLENMGVDVNKMPTKEVWKNMLLQQLSQSYHEKKSYCIIWQVDGKAVGHSNVNKIIFGQEAFMHLHLWEKDIRKSGLGTELVKMTLPYFFNNMNLKILYCEPYSLNPAPNNALKKVGFEFVKENITIPGFLNFEQKVNLWKLTCEKFKTLN